MLRSPIQRTPATRDSELRALHRDAGDHAGDRHGPRRPARAAVSGFQGQASSTQVVSPRRSDSRWTPRRSAPGQFEFVVANPAPISAVVHREDVGERRVEPRASDHQLQVLTWIQRGIGGQPWGFSDRVGGCVRDCSFRRALRANRRHDLRRGAGESAADSGATVTTSHQRHAPAFYGDRRDEGGRPRRWRSPRLRSASRTARLSNSPQRTHLNIGSEINPDGS